MLELGCFSSALTSVCAGPGEDDCVIGWCGYVELCRWLGVFLLAVYFHHSSFHMAQTIYGVKVRCGWWCTFTW